MTLVRPNYVEYSGGQISKLFCQVCGVEIAGLTERPKGSGPDISKTVMSFKRFPNYAEAKFRMTDGSFHVTNGCKKCFMALNVPTAQEIYDADMVLMDMPADKWVHSIVAVYTSKGGIF